MNESVDNNAESSNDIQLNRTPAKKIRGLFKRPGYIGPVCAGLYNMDDPWASGKRSTVPVLLRAAGRFRSVRDRSLVESFKETCDDRY